MFAGLDDIPWKDLTHAYGSAEGVPEQLRALASPDEDVQTQAISDCYGNIWHQGTVYEATSHAVPFIIEIVGNPAIAQRDQLLELLCHLSQGTSYHDVHQHLEFLGEIMRKEPDFEEKLKRELAWVAQATDAVAKGAPIYFSLLDDEEPTVRRQAARLLLHCEAHAQPLLPQMGSRLASEPDPALAGTLLFALTGLSDEEETLEMLRPYLDEERPLVRLVAALSWAFMVADPLPEAALETLMLALRDPEQFPDYLELPFAEDLMSEVGGALGRASDEQQEEAARRLLEALEDHRSGMLNVIPPLLHLCFPEPLDDPQVEDLTPLQQEVVGAVARRAWTKEEGHWSTFVNLAENLRYFGLEELGQRMVGYE